jgi:hypothetical protein
MKEARDDLKAAYENILFANFTNPPELLRKK